MDDTVERADDAEPDDSSSLSVGDPVRAKLVCWHGNAPPAFACGVPKL
ncbi:hypothetical protein [Micromonospora sp. NPDC049679]